VTPPPDEPLPDDIETLKAMLLVERTARRAAEADARERALTIEKLQHTIAKLRHERFGQSAERGALLDQLQLELIEERAALGRSVTCNQATGRTVCTAAWRWCA